MNGPLAGNTYPIEGMLTVGRNPASSIVFPPNAPGISGNHCRMTLQEGQGGMPDAVILMDAGSSYGTYLPNGQKLTPNQCYSLSAGMAFLLGGPNGCGFLIEEK